MKKTKDENKRTDNELDEENKLKKEEREVQ
jgi:hypothetical protein